MVRVIEDSPEEKQKEKKNLEIIAEISRDMFGEENIRKDVCLEGIFIRDNITSDNSIYVCQSFSTIYVYDQRYFNSAIELGEAIEKRIPGLEFDLESSY